MTSDPTSKEQTCPHGISLTANPPCHFCDHEQYVAWASPQLERLGREMADNERLRNGIAQWTAECSGCDGTGESAHEFGKPCEDCADIRALLSGKSAPKPARDAEHCDYPDCEQHNAMVVERLRGALSDARTYLVNRSEIPPSLFERIDQSLSGGSSVVEMTALQGLKSISFRPDLPLVDLVLTFESLEGAQAARQRVTVALLKPNSVQETSEQPTPEDRNWQNGFLACAAMFESGKVSNLRETVAKINRAKKAPSMPHEHLWSTEVDERLVHCLHCGFYPLGPERADEARKELGLSENGKGD